MGTHLFALGAWTIEVAPANMFDTVLGDLRALRLGCKLDTGKLVRRKEKHSKRA